MKYKMENWARQETTLNNPRKIITYDKRTGKGCQQDK